MQVGLSYDHNGYEISKKIKEELSKKGYQIIDYNNEYNKEDDYPKEALKMLNNTKHGILICGSGIGMSIIANKVKGVRCALVRTKEEAISSRMHNDANVIALSAQTPNIVELIETFFETPFSCEERHQRRIKQIEEYENKVMK